MAGPVRDGSERGTSLEKWKKGFNSLIYVSPKTALTASVFG